MQTPFIRTEILLGSDAMERLAHAHVAVFGIGGVGGHAVEALARSGIGRLTLVDNDTVSETNINRQLVAARSTIGRYKVEVMQERILDINPKAEVFCHRCFFLPENAEAFDFSEYDYVIDAVDTVSAKIELAVQAKAAGTPIISSMGAGNKLDPTRFEVADLADTSVCPLAKVMRRELKARDILHMKVVYSREPARTPLMLPGEAPPPGKRVTPGSVSFVPSVAGLILAGEVVKDIAGVND